MDVLLVTCSDVPKLTKDDQLLLDALLRNGVDAKPAIWDDPTVNWSAASACVVRSVWDYHLRADEFLAWADQVANQTQLFNPPNLLRWNAHKSYLQDLIEHEIPVVNTRWLPQNSKQSLEAILKDEEWEEAIVKPAISAAAHGTRKTALARAGRDQTFLENLLKDGDVMIQPYLSNVETKGETSFIFITGKFAHVVQRSSALTEGIEAADQGEPIDPSPQAVKLAKRVVATSETTPLYARIDVVCDSDGKECLLEYELIEPVLFLNHSPKTTTYLASAIINAIG